MTEKTIQYIKYGSTVKGVRANCKQLKLSRSVILKEAEPFYAEPHDLQLQRSAALVSIFLGCQHSPVDH